MTDQPTPYIPTTKEPIPKEPLKDGITPHLRKVGDLIIDLGNEIQALQRIEKALKDAHDRLERHSSLMAMETQLIEQLLKRDRITPATVKALPANQLADRVEEDLKRLVQPQVANSGDMINVISHPVGPISKLRTNP